MNEATMLEEAVEEQEQGEGLIHIDAVVWEAMGKPETHDAWHKAMLLPASYTIVEAGRYPVNSRYFVVRVRHRAIPVVAGCSHLPHVSLIHCKNFHDGASSVSLARIDIRQWSEDSGWRTVATTDEEGAE